MISTAWPDTTGPAADQAGLHQHIDRITSDITQTGFIPRQLLPGGRLSVTCEGMFSGQPAVAKISFFTDEQVAASIYWGHHLAPRVLARGDMWAIFEHRGRPATSSELDVLLDQQLAVLDAIHQHQAPPSGTWTTVANRCHERMQLATRGDRQTFHGASGIELLEETLAELERTGVYGHTNLTHGDPHNGNWLIGTNQQLTLIDPSPTIGPADYDLSLWIIGAGADRIQHRVDHLAAIRPIARSLPLWVIFNTVERAAALYEFGMPDDEARALTAAGIDAASRLALHI